MPTMLEHAIWRTVCWFSLFEYPLSRFEVWKWLDTKESFSLEETLKALDESAWLNECLIQQEGMVARRVDELPALIAGRQERFMDAQRKYKKVQRVIRWARWLPTIEAVAAVNTLAWWHTDRDSDIDLFVVTRPGTIWLSRLLLVLPFSGERPGRAHVDPFCFSFFVTRNYVDVSSVALEGGDPYLDYWQRSIVPLYDPNGVFDSPSESSNEEPVRSLWESLARWFQIKRLPSAIVQKLEQGTDVIVSDHMLKFHVDDARRRYRTLWHERIHAHE